MMDKPIRVSKKNWKRLSEIKIDYTLRSYNQVIDGFFKLIEEKKLHKQLGRCLK